MDDQQSLKSLKTVDLTKSKQMLEALKAKYFQKCNENEREKSKKRKTKTRDNIKVK